MKHTSAPWKVYYAKNNGNLILGLGEEDGCAITTHQGAFWRDDEEAKANAEFIVKCVNSHDELLEALESAVRILKQNHIVCFDGITLRQAENVISKAK